MKQYRKIILSALLCGGLASVHASESDTLFVSTETLGAKYALALSDIQMKSGESSFGVLIRREYGSTLTRGAWVQFYKDRILCNEEIVVNNLNDGDAKHDYLFIRQGTTVSLYRDGILCATIVEKQALPISTSKADKLNEFTVAGCDQLMAGYKAEILSATESQDVDEAAREQNIGNMLSVDYKNMVKDPYMNHGFLSTGLGAATRSFTSNAASWGGWGSEATVVSDAYSGPYSVKISGQASNNGTVTTGASLDLSVSLAKGSYLIRAMVKSDGYVGKIAIDGENGYIPVTDTRNEWKQVEGVLSCTAARNTLYINNNDFTNDGTLYVDNVEIYKALTSVSMATKYIPYYEIPKNTTYKSTVERSAYMMGFQIDPENCSQLDTEKLDYSGAARLTRKVEGSKLYAMSFPGDLDVISVTGTYDGKTYTDEPLFSGVDYLLCKYNYPYFDYCATDQEITAGCYLIQFVDNLEGMSVSMTTSKKKELEKGNAEYRLVGNPLFKKYTPEGKFLKFNENSQTFLLTENEEINPFEAYIETSASVPVNIIYPQITTDFKQIEANDGSRISVYSVEGGVVINALATTTVDVYSVSARKIDSWQLSEGENRKDLPVGFYVIGGKKVIVTR